MAVAPGTGGGSTYRPPTPPPTPRPGPPARAGRPPGAAPPGWNVPSSGRRPAWDDSTTPGTNGSWRYNRPVPPATGEPSGSSTATNPNTETAATNIYQVNRGAEDPLGFLWFKPLRSIQVDTSSLQGIANASNPWSTTYMQIVTDDVSKSDPNYPHASDTGYVQNEWLFELAAKDYYYSSTGKKWFEEQFIPAALKTFQDTGRYVSPLEAAVNYNIEKGLMREDGILTERGQEVYDKYIAEDGGSSPSGGSPYGGGGGGGYGGGGSGGGSVSLTNPTNARGLLLQTMQGVLGRNPTEKEYKEFLKSLNEWESNNPVTVTQDGDNVVQSGGVDPGQIALDYAQGREDYKNQQAQGYYNMFMQALAGSSPGAGV